MSSRRFIHRDVHDELDFGEKLAELQQAFVLKQAAHHRDTYYDGSDDLEGHYYAYVRM